MGPWIVMACLWFTGTGIDGKDKRWGVGIGPCGDGRGLIACVTSNPDHDRLAALNMPPPPADTATITERSDYGALLVYHGRIEEAIAFLEATEQAHPGDYAVAANLGTAYELAGRDRDALRWIREGIKRNPESHQGTEWLHVKILETKLALASDPAWLEKHTVLGLDFGDGDIPQIPVEWPEGQDLKSTEKALTYQLRERIAFVRPPDPIVASLLADLGSLTAITTIVEDALPVFDLALTYQPVDADAVRKRRAALARLIEDRHFWNRVRFYAVVAGVIALVALLVALIILRRRRRRIQGLTAKLAATSGSVISAS
jgi:hypothetical protein